MKHLLWPLLRLLALFLLLVLIACTVPAPTSTPTPTPTAVPIPTPTPPRTVWNPAIEVRKSPDCLQIVGTGYQAEKRRTPKVLGAVRNGCNESFPKVLINVALFDKAVALQVARTETEINDLGKGETAGFGAWWARSKTERTLGEARITFLDVPDPEKERWDTVVLVVRGFTTPLSQGAGYRLHVSDITRGVAGSHEAGVAKVVLTNSSGRALSHVVLEMTGYSVEGDVVAAGWRKASLSLLPEATTEFGVAFEDCAEEPSVSTYGILSGYIPCWYSYGVRIREPHQWSFRALGYK